MGKLETVKIPEFFYFWDCEFTLSKSIKGCVEYEIEIINPRETYKHILENNYSSFLDFVKKLPLNKEFIAFCYYYIMAESNLSIYLIKTRFELVDDELKTYVRLYIRNVNTDLNEIFTNNSLDTIITFEDEDEYTFLDCKNILIHAHYIAYADRLTPLYSTYKISLNLSYNGVENLQKILSLKAFMAVIKKSINHMQNNITNTNVPHIELIIHTNHDHKSQNTNVYLDIFVYSKFITNTLEYITQDMRHPLYLGISSQDAYPLDSEIIDALMELSVDPGVKVSIPVNIKKIPLKTLDYDGKDGNVIKAAVEYRDLLLNPSKEYLNHYFLRNYKNKWELKTFPIFYKPFKKIYFERGVFHIVSKKKEFTKSFGYVYKRKSNLFKIPKNRRDIDISYVIDLDISKEDISFITKDNLDDILISDNKYHLNKYTLVKFNASFMLNIQLSLIRRFKKLRWYPISLVELPNLNKFKFILVSVPDTSSKQNVNGLNMSISKEGEPPFWAQ